MPHLTPRLPPPATPLRYNPGVPTVLRSGPYRFYFYSHEPNEPSQVHVERDDCAAKFWLEPVMLAANHGFAAHELNAIQSIIEEHLQALLEEWNGYFGIGG
jgi:hypothetical protein